MFYFHKLFFCLASETRMGRDGLPVVVYKSGIREASYFCLGFGWFKVKKKKAFGIEVRKKKKKLPGTGTIPYRTTPLVVDGKFSYRYR